MEWNGQFIKNGEIFMDTTNERQASVVKQENTIVVEPMVEPIQVENKAQQLHTLIEKFISSQDLKTKSRIAYTNALKQFFEWFVRMGIANPTREDILLYKNSLISQKLSFLTISNYIVVVRRFFEWAEGMKFYPNIAKGVKGAKSPKGFRKDPLSLEQLSELFKSIDRTSTLGKRDYAILKLMLGTGLRTIEVSRADAGDMRQDGEKTLLYIQGKGRDVKDDFVVLVPEVQKPLMEYLSTRDSIKEKDPLFVSISDSNMGERLASQRISKIVKKHLREVGINNCRLTAHSLRHTAITLCLLGGGTIQEAKTLARHSSIDTTLNYAHNIERMNQPPEEHLRKFLLDDQESG